MAKNHIFFKPLTPREKTLLTESVRKLLKNKDFQLFIRDFFAKAPPLQPDFLSREQYNATAAAVRSGEKNVSRALLKMILDAEANYEEQPQDEVKKLLNNDTDIDFTRL